MIAVLRSFRFPLNTLRNPHAQLRLVTNRFRRCDLFRGGNLFRRQPNRNSRFCSRGRSRAICALRKSANDRLSEIIVRLKKHPHC